LANGSGGIRFDLFACASPTGGTLETWFDDRAAGPLQR
jgi:hypothetical protein